MKVNGNITWIGGDGTPQPFLVKEAVFILNKKLTIECVCSNWLYVITLNHTLNNIFEGSYQKTNPITKQRFEGHASCKAIIEANGAISITDGIWYEHGNPMNWCASLVLLK